MSCPQIWEIEKKKKQVDRPAKLNEKKSYRGIEKTKETYFVGGRT